MMTSKTSDYAEIRRLERDVRRRERHIKRLVELRIAATASIDEYLLSCARVEVLSAELDHAEKRNDADRFCEITRELKLAFAEKVAKKKTERKLNERLARLVEKLAADRAQWDQSPENPNG
jgi:hypothetical protein